MRAAEFSFAALARRSSATTALHPADVSFKRGKTTVLMRGPSGCGKSTLLRLIIGLLEAGQRNDCGFDGAPGSLRKNLAGLDARRIGYVIQGGWLILISPARQNALLMSMHLKRPAAEMNRRLAEL